MKALDLFEINFQRAKELVALHRSNYSRGRPVAGGSGDEILRSAVVFAVASLDAYLGMRASQVVDQIIFKRRPLPERATSYVERGLKDHDLARILLNIALSANPRKQIVKRLENILSKETFQKPHQVEEALKIMGVNNPWRTLDRCLAPVRGPRRRGQYSCKKFLLDLTNRRDNIVHQGDVYISPKHHGKLKPISRTQTDEWLKKLRKVVLTIEQITQV